MICSHCRSYILLIIKIFLEVCTFATYVIASCSMMKIFDIFHLSYGYL